MHQKILGGGASVGLSALLAGLLLITAGLNQPKKQLPSNEKVESTSVRPRVNEDQRSETPTAVVLPDPPRLLVPNMMKKVPKPSRVAVKPPEKTEIKTTMAIVPIQPRVKQPSMTISVRPLLPRLVALNGDAHKLPVEGSLPPKIATNQTGVNIKDAGVFYQSMGDPALAVQGRVLLRKLEHGRGPTIEFAWPAQATDQERLFRTFRDCLGMRVALRNGEGHLFVAGMSPGQNWWPNADRYSGFARQPKGRLAGAERRDILNISKHHKLSGPANAIRIFPRRVDALLLGGLRRLVGDSYGGARNIHAKYDLYARGVVITDIRVDGRPIGGSVALPAPKKTGCSAS